MFKLTLKMALVAIALQGGPAAAFDDWTAAQSNKAAGIAALHLANWGQHRAMAYRAAAPAVDGIKTALPGQISRPSLSAQEPDYGRVDRKFAVSALAGAAILATLPSQWRDQALDVGLVIEAGMVGRQLQLGVGWRF